MTWRDRGLEAEEKYEEIMTLVRDLVKPHDAERIKKLLREYGQLRYGQGCDETEEES